MKNYKELLLSKINQEQANFNNYEGFLDVRKIHSDAIIEQLKKYNFTDEEFKYLLNQDNLIQTLYNNHIKWRMGSYSLYASSGIHCFLDNCKMNDEIARCIEKENQKDEEMA